MDKRIKQLLKRQAKWQRNRAALSWEEKLRMSLIMRETQKALRKSAVPGKNAARKPEDATDRQ
jgi:hypothetical protein